MLRKYVCKYVLYERGLGKKPVLVCLQMSTSAMPTPAARNVPTSMAPTSATVAVVTS